jgi:hypothetical protein
MNALTHSLRQGRITQVGALLLLFISASTSAIAQFRTTPSPSGDKAETLCRVVDPTTTPLNVRTTPNGRIVGTLENGAMVSVLDR